MILSIYTWRYIHILDDILSIDSFSINNVSFKCSTNFDSDCLVFFSNSYTYQVVPATILLNFYLSIVCDFQLQNQS